MFLPFTRAAARLACLALATLVLASPIAVAQGGAMPSPVPVTLSSSPILRNAELALAASVLATTGGDAVIERAWRGALRDAGAKGRLVRASKLAALDLPIVWYLVGINHELGHVARANEKGYRSDFRIVGSPWSWSTGPFELFALDGRIFDDMGSQTGGEEGSLCLKDRAETAMRGVDRVAAGHALAIVVSSLDLPLYAYANLAPDNQEYGDLSRFVGLLVDQRRQWTAAPHTNESWDTARSAVRGRSMLNLLDASLWTMGFGVVRDHVWKGEGGVAVRWLRLPGVDLIPSLRYAITPIGPEYSVRSHYRAALYTGHGYVRWSERIGPVRQVGAGGSVAGWQWRLLKPTLTLDGWSHTTSGGGVHGAVGLEVAGWPSRHAALVATVGAKSKGFLPGHPLARGAYAEAGVNARLW